MVRRAAVLQAGQPVQVVEQVIEEHIVYVDAAGQQQPAPQQVVYVEAPQPAGIQLEGSEPRLEEMPVAAPSQPQQVEQVVAEEKLVRMRQVVKQVTDSEGNVREEIVSEEVLEVNRRERDDGRGGRLMLSVSDGSCQ